MTQRLILGNLDGEHDWAGLPSRLPLRVRRRAAAASTLLRVFANPVDRLWTLEPVASARLIDAPGLARPRLESGPVNQVEPATQLLAWAETAAASGLRRQPNAASPAQKPSGLAARVWDTPRPSPQIAARVSDRRFQLGLAQRLGQAFDAAAIAEDLQQVAQLVRTGGERWVLKAPFSAAGRDRVLGRGAQLSAANARQAEHLLARHGALLFEPWVDRLLDFSCCAIVEAAEVRLLGVQQQCVHTNGSFQGIIVHRTPAFLPAAELDAFERVARAVGLALQDEGFRGPFGLDGCCYRERNNERRVHALGEINPRLTFGFVARALAERLWSTGVTESPALRLQLGSASQMPPASPACWQLLAPDASDDTVAWVEATC